MTLIPFAQNHVDIVLWRALGHVRNGFYIDVGAADPNVSSITKRFYDHGWHGINLEPDSTFFASLKAARLHDVNLCLAAGREATSRLFHRIAGSGLSTFDAGIAARHQAAGWKVTQETVETLPLAEICRQHCAHGSIHFLKVGAGGCEGDVLAGADFKNFRPWIVLLETPSPNSQKESNPEWEPILASQGYSFVWFDGLNRFYLADERKDDLARHFHAQPNVFDEFQQPAQLLDRVECAERELRQVREQAAQEVQRVRERAAQEVQQALEQAAETLRQANAMSQQAIRSLEQSANESDAASRRAAEAIQQMAQTLDETTQRTNVVLAKQTRRSEEMQRAAREANERVAAMLSSTSWRVTAPLRATLAHMPNSMRSTLRRGARVLWWAVTPHRMPARIAFLRERRKQALYDNTVGALSIGESGVEFGQPVTDAVIEYRKASRHGHEAALFVTQSIDGKLKPHVRSYLAALRRQSIHVTLIVAADAAWLSRDALPLDEVDTLVVRENHGLDFAAWAHVLQLEPELFDSETLYLLNDSLIGPFNDVLFEKVLTRLRLEPADVVGLTESWEHQWHIQSRFLALRRRALASPVLQSFFNKVGALPTEDEVIQRYEINLAPRLRTAGMTCAVLFPSGNRDNRTLFDWKSLIDEGFPFITVMALRDKTNGADSHDWRETLKALGYDVALAESVLQVAGTTPGQAADDGTPSHVPERSTLPRHLPGAKLKPAVQLIGPWNYASGLGVASRSYVSALRHTPYALNLAPIKRPFHIHRRTALPRDINDFSGPADVALIHANPEAWPGLLVDEQKRAMERARLKVGLWVWETNKIPDFWHPTFGSVDAIWAPTRYCQAVFAAGTSAPVHVIPYVVTVPPSLPPGDKIRRVREEIGLKDSDRVILYAFDGSSYVMRKNPFALVRAFARTKLRHSGWKLVLKAKNLFDLSQHGAQLQQMCEGSEGIVLINRALDLDTMRSLMAMADIYASPHCAEGFGLTVAEAMAMGKIVVATDYSGTRDFLDDSCGFPVRYTLTSLKDDLGAYTRGNAWAQIDEDDLAETLEKAAALVERGDYTIGNKARARIASELSAERVGALMQQSIDQLLAS
ncbi:FkbM family methyltransferase [Paraburkholderia sp. A2RI-6]|uniref:FkbM family methyltransferase n=1 Tax=Paraburkholderia sp. A2RI-6 TaxID=3028371 RepID=UPI003B7ECE5B